MSLSRLDAVQGGPPPFAWRSYSTRRSPSSGWPREGQKTITAGLTAALIRGDIFDWGSLMAAALLVGVPAALMYLFFIDHFIRSISGAVND